MYRCTAQDQRQLPVCCFFTGPLFSFDVHDDIRLVNDATVEKDEVSEQPDERMRELLVN